MKIDKNKYYAIVRKEQDGTTTVFNNRVYLGRYVKLAYNQIPNKQKYKICVLMCLPIEETMYEN